MSRLSVEDLSEETVRLVLTQSGGDLIQSSRKLNVRPSQLVGWIKSVPSVAAHYLTIEQIKADPRFDDASQAQLEAEIRARAAAYRLDGLEVLHELATTPHTNASEADVRLKAAVHLRSAGSDMPQGGDGVLAELNSLYHKNAPRIKSMRMAVIEFDTTPELD